MNIERGMGTANRVDRFVREGEAIHGVLYGDLPNKSNSRIIVRGRSIKAPEAIDFVANVKKVAEYCSGMIGHPLVGATSERDLRRGKRLLYLKATVYGASFLRDLDCELLPDALQHAGVINNDRAIREKHYWWQLQPDNPCVIFQIGYIETNG